MHPFLTHVLDALGPFASAERAVQEKAYLKSSLQFSGAGVPRVRAETMAALKAYETAGKLTAADLRAIAEAAWATDSHDARTTALVVLEKRAKRLTAQDLPWLATILHKCFTWAYVDTIAVHVVGVIVRQEPMLAKALLNAWATDKDFWLRRTALLALLGETRAGAPFDGVQFELWATPMLSEKEFFIRKAIGWVLRDVSGKNPQWVQGFLDRHGARMAPLSVREATRGVVRALAK